MPRRRRIPKKTRVLADFLYDEFKRHPDFQLGFQTNASAQVISA
jgi:hypothetical protein